VVVSDLVQIELAQAAKGAANDPTTLSQRERRRRRLHRWGDLRDVRSEWYRYCFDGYDELLDQFSAVEELAINRSIIESARDLMSDYQVNSYDAIHAATALAIGASTLATMDVGFQKLSPISVLKIHLIT
jgi:predicted nucleic acid-binding protein